ncbi:MAG TPA: carbamoyltransferase HypF [Lachnospiraceae bacterium]|nr:carbamoyltransferase HypF [Lachnospiraceae bacterium]
MQTKRIRLYGIVQGVGFRPFVSRAAMELGISGSVCNRGSYVEVIARGSEDRLERFLQVLRDDPPERSVILKIDVKDADVPYELPGFEIIESEKEKGEIFISPDIAICPECRKELYDPSNRRYLHPFINCTQCGPRLTILDELPYDRARTSMKEFPMCPSCAQEYEDPVSRRYDAQPVCCNDCGPQVYLAGRKERGADAIREARRLLSEGKILAVKGIGGFHLCCDATSQEAVMKLRRRKQRPVKPFAVMMRDEAAVDRACVLDEAKRRILTGYQKPILLLEKKEESGLCEAVAPGNPKVGVMLPYAPVQMLLFDYPDGIRMPDCLVMTSGNVSGAPICRDDAEAMEELGAFADAILSHDRKIRIRCDDSVMDFADGKEIMVRRSRGYAPLPVLTGGEYAGCVLAAGGELKNTFCIGIGSMFYPSAYVGDLADPRSVRALEESILRMEALLERKPDAVVCDLHPAYHSTQLSSEIAKERKIPLIQVQHHFAHIVSCMAENDLDGEVLGASFDGTGWGTDKTIWGGELMRADRGSFERFGSIRPFRMVGGDLASRQGWRIAASMIHSMVKDEAREAEIAGCLQLCEAQQIRTIGRMSEKGLNTTLSTSAGRLFDAVSAILGICRESTFEGEASTSLMFAAQRYRGKNAARDAGLDPYDAEEMFRPEGVFLTLPTDLLVSRILEGRLAGRDVFALAAWFHECLAGMIAAAILTESKRTGLKRAVLSGGVYQNTLLLRETSRNLEEGGMKVYTHHLIPPNDGGISLGQALAAQEIIKRGKKREYMQAD